MSIDLQADRRYNQNMEKQSPNTDALILSRQQVRNCDRTAIEKYQIPGITLMENAGSAAARYILDLIENPQAARVCVLAGVGNNGGDGFVVARHLDNAGVKAEIIICGDRQKCRGDAGSNLAIVNNMKLPIFYTDELSQPEIAALISSKTSVADLIVDAMLGTGAAGRPREPVRTAIDIVNAAGKIVVAVDIPSGLDCDTGTSSGTTVKADHTVTFMAVKKGFTNPDAKIYTGSVVVASIGVSAKLLMD